LWGHEDQFRPRRRNARFRFQLKDFRRELAGGQSMMGDRQIQQEDLFYEFSLERDVPETHLLRVIDRFVDLGDVRAHLAPFYSETGRPSIDPELLIRMLIIGYCFGIRSERRLSVEIPAGPRRRLAPELGEPSEQAGDIAGLNRMLRHLLPAPRRQGRDQPGPA
jgi:hypothetical protein